MSGFTLIALFGPGSMPSRQSHLPFIRSKVAVSRASKANRLERPADFLRDVVIDQRFQSPHRRVIDHLRMFAIDRDNAEFDVLQHIFILFANCIESLLRSRVSTAAIIAGNRATAQSAKTADSAAGYGPITTEIAIAPPFYYAEDYHQQYLAKNPGGYCGLGGVNIHYPPRSTA